MNMLFVTPYIPSRIRTRPYNLVRALLRLGHQITLLTCAGESAPITVISNGVDLAYFESKAQPRDKNTVVFAGKMSYHANIVAVRLFVEQVLPLIWCQVPSVRFQIVGKDPPKSIQDLAQHLSLEGRSYVERHHSWEASAQRPSDVYQHVLFQTATCSQKTRHKAFAAGLAR